MAGGEHTEREADVSALCIANVNNGLFCIIIIVLFFWGGGIEPSHNHTNSGAGPANGASFDLQTCSKTEKMSHENHEQLHQNVTAWEENLPAFVVRL